MNNNKDNITATVTGNLTHVTGYTVSTSRAHYGARTPVDYHRCNVCGVTDGMPGGGAGCTAETCNGRGVEASAFAPGDSIGFLAGGWGRLGTVVEVKRSRVVVAYTIKTGEARTRTIKAGNFWRPAKG